MTLLSNICIHQLEFEKLLSILNKETGIFNKIVTKTIILERKNFCLSILGLSDTFIYTL